MLLFSHNHKTRKKIYLLLFRSHKKVPSLVLQLQSLKIAQSLVLNHKKKLRNLQRMFSPKLHLKKTCSLVGRPLMLNPSRKMQILSLLKLRQSLVYQTLLQPNLKLNHSPLRASSLLLLMINQCRHLLTKNLNKKKNVKRLS